MQSQAKPLSKPPKWSAWCLDEAQERNARGRCTHEHTPNLICYPGPLAVTPQTEAAVWTGPTGFPR
jgi:hypothetical protein